MKKIFILLVLLSVIISGCIFTPSTTDYRTYFYLADTNGVEKTTFSPGESFLMEFCLTNTTDDSLDFTMYDSGPFVRFAIYQEDQYVAGSMDGLGVREPVIDYKFAPGDSMTGSWLAPTTPWQDPKITLTPGDYRAVVIFPGIPELHTDTIPDINFTISE